MRKVEYWKDGKQVKFEDADYGTEIRLVEVKESTYWEDEDGNKYNTFKARKKAIEDGKKVKFVISGLEAAL